MLLITASKYMKQVTEWQQVKDKCTIIVGDFNIPSQNLIEQVEHQQEYRKLE